jgi:hypothetical protein
MEGWFSPAPRRREERAGNGSIRVTAPIDPASTAEMLARILESLGEDPRGIGTRTDRGERRERPARPGLIVRRDWLYALRSASSANSTASSIPA